MPPPPRRGRFQIHLSTAIVLMFVAGGLIWANGRNPVEYYDTDDNDRVSWQKFGWPVDSICHIKSTDPKSGKFYKYGAWFPMDYLAVVIDFATALAILFATWFLCEWMIRRRAALKVG